MNVIPGPPYFFRCRKCGHTFSRHIRVGLICPLCKSLRVVPSPFPLK